MALRYAILAAATVTWPIVSQADSTDARCEIYEVPLAAIEGG